ncbi:MAG: cbb3-type cytochrome oxidase assembly protein CcoS [Chitinophagaceae bacterium]|nr:MAG: cbb3-type cytochrome oxidase assembly protein CcoS [Chitinophagaceae bacterium]
MSVIIILVIISVIVAGTFLAAFIISVKKAKLLNNDQRCYNNHR